MQQESDTMATASQAVSRFLGNWFLRDRERDGLSPSEAEFVVAAMGPAPDRWDGTSDAARMEEIVRREPWLLESIGLDLLLVTVGMRGCAPAVKFLLDRGVPLEIDGSHYNFLHEAAWANAVDTLRAVFESGAADATGVSVEKPHTGWPDNLSLMYWVAWGGYPELAKLLIEYGVGVHHELPIKGNGERGSTSLQEAVAPGPWDPENRIRSNAAKLDVAWILIADGANYDIFSACGLNDHARLGELIAEDATAVHARDDFGTAPLHWAARAGAMECATTLLERGAGVNALNKAQRAPLQWAAERDKGKCIRLLAEHGADLNTQDKKGRTPLHRATYEGKVEAVETLLKLGADPMILNRSGKTAFQIARKACAYLKM